MADSNKKEVIDSLLGGMDAILSSKTVVGQPVVVGDTTIIPLVDVSFGVAAGSGNESRNYDKNSSAGGMGGMGMGMVQGIGMGGMGMGGMM